MKKFAALIAFVSVLALAACGSTGGGGDGGGDSGGGSSKTDGSQGTIDMYANGTMKASYWIQVHADPKAGQYWETSMEMSGTKMTTRWQVSKVDGGTAIIENQNKMDSEYMMSDYVIAYQVDLGAAEGEANVTKAWVGKPGEQGKEIQIMEKPTGGGCAPAANYTTTTEAFSDLEAGGGKWSGTLTITKGEGWESKMWVADNGWFSKMVKMEAAGSVTVLSAFGEDAKPLLKWE